MAKSYYELLKDPRWQRRRLEILNRSNFTCESCEAADKTLHVHHLIYRKGAMPWEYEDHELRALCSDCHDKDHNWRELLNEAVARLDEVDIEVLVGFAEGMAAITAVSGDFHGTQGFAFPVRSYEHATGLATALSGWNSGRGSNTADCMCDIRVLTHEHVGLLGDGYPLPPPDRGA